MIANANPELTRNRLISFRLRISEDKSTKGELHLPLKMSYIRQGSRSEDNGKEISMQNLNILGLIFIISLCTHGAVPYVCVSYVSTSMKGIYRRRDSNTNRIRISRKSGKSSCLVVAQFNDKQNFPHPTEWREEKIIIMWKDLLCMSCSLKWFWWLKLLENLSFLCCTKI